MSTKQPKKVTPKIKLTKYGKKQRRKRHIQSIICIIICIIVFLFIANIFSDGFATGIKNILVTIFTMSVKIVKVIAIAGCILGFIAWMMFWS